MILHTHRRYVRNNGVVKRVLTTIGVKDSNDGSGPDYTGTDSDEEASGLVPSDQRGPGAPATTSPVHSSASSKHSATGIELIPQANPTAALPPPATSSATSTAITALASPRGMSLKGASSGISGKPSVSKVLVQKLELSDAEP
jgi:hypothetical protein